ncbi:MAG: hypothetical protein KC455_06375 [Carnobacterium sp.]|nr:hypothetical protein [Carnobacterium sp.]
MKIKDKVTLNIKNKTAFLDDILDIAKTAAISIIAVIGKSIVGLIRLFSYKYIV